MRNSNGARIMGKTPILCRKAFDSEKTLSEFLSENVSGDAPAMVCDDLCAVAAAAATKRRLADFIAENDGKVVVAACAPRAVKTLLAHAGIPEKHAAAVEVADVRGNRGCDASATPPELPGSAETAERLDAPADAPRWFPVIDKSRCTACGACVEFCLFGVHAKLDDGTVAVVEPGECKDKCPACARICPTNAVIFPKFDSAPINGGNSADSADEDNTAPKGFQIPAEDLHAALAARQTQKRKDKGLFKRPN